MCFYVYVCVGVCMFVCVRESVCVCWEKEGNGLTYVTRGIKVVGRVRQVHNTRWKYKTHDTSWV